MEVSTNWLVLKPADKLRCNTSIVCYVSVSDWRTSALMQATTLQYEPGRG